MKLRILCFVTVLAAILALAACNKTPEEPTPEPEPEPTTYTITFTQDGQDDVTFELDKGTAFDTANIPTVKSRTGYDVEWNLEGVDFSAADADIVVTAKETAKTYTITFDLDLEGAELPGVTGTTMSVTYDSAVTLPTPTTDTGLHFSRWVKADGTEVASGKWTTADNVTLKAVWHYTITFTQDGQDDVTVDLEKGETLAAADVPTPAPVVGHDVAWNVTDFSSVTSDTTVNAVVTANTYTITLTISFHDKPGETVTKTVTVTYGQTYSLPDLTEEYGDTYYTAAVVWTTEADGEGTEFASSGTWTGTADITLYTTLRDDWSEWV